MRKRRGRGSKFENMYFLNHPITISSIADEFLKFISRGLIFANTSKNLRGLIFAKSPKIREIAEFYPRKVYAFLIHYMYKIQNNTKQSGNHQHALTTWYIFACHFHTIFSWRRLVKIDIIDKNSTVSLPIYTQRLYIDHLLVKYFLIG